MSDPVPPTPSPAATSTPFIQTAGHALIPDVSTLWNRFERVGVPAIGLGLGGASLIQLLKMYRDQREAQEAGKPRKDVLTVELDPQKQAAMGGVPNPTAMEMSAAKDNMVNGVNAVRGGFDDMGDGVATGVKAVGGFFGGAWDKAKDLGRKIDAPYVAAGEKAVAKPEEQQNPLNENAILLAMALGGTGVGAWAANSFFDHRRKEELEERLSKAKSEYSSVLGRSLSGPSGVKTAGIALQHEACPTIAGLCDIIVNASFPADQQKVAANPLMETIGLPAALFTLSGILSHRWLYNRLKEQDKVQEMTMPSPPREIRFVTKPSPPVAPATARPPDEADIVDPDEEKPRKAARLSLIKKAFGISPSIVGADLAADGILLNLIDHKKQEEEKAKRMAVHPDATGKPIPLPKPHSIEPIPMVDVGPGTTEASTVGGPVTFEAQDPNAAATLQRNKERLRRVLSSFQAQSEPVPVMA